ncbi:MAG: TonB-dependent receptor [Bacteroidales bacterium]|nr:TonB-dependent receptor [Bacteroidales bacterium]
MKNKVSVLGVLLLFAFCSLTSAQSFSTDPAQRDTVYVLESVSVTGSRVPLTLRQSARMVTVLDSLAIAALPATSVNDLLKYAVGVDVRQRGMMGMQTDISIRGGTFDQIAVLLNGISITDPQTGHNAADFPVDISEIERIEVLEGPAARVYGTASLLGAVNIVTKTHSRSGLSAHVEGGSHGSFSAGLSGNLHTGTFDNQISASWSRSDGYTQSRAGTNNTDFSAARLFYQGGWNGRSMQLRWHSGLSVKDFGSNTFYSPRFDDQFEHTLKTFTAIQAETFGWLHFKPALYWNHGEDRFELFRGQADKYPFNYHRTNVFGVNLGAWFETALGRTAFGGEFRNEDIISTNLGEPLPAPRPVPGSDAQYRVGLNRSDISFYLEHNVILPRFTFSAGLTAAKNTGNTEGFRIFPGVDASVRISDAWKLYASYNSSLRMPTFTELYYSVGGHQADKNLKAEKMQAVEVGGKYIRAGIRAVASVYYHHGTDLIDWIQDLSVLDAPWTSVNHAVVDAVGEELTLRVEPGLLMGLERFPLQQISLSYAHIDQYKATVPGYASYYALEYLRNKFVAQTDIRLWRNLNLNLSARWHDRCGSYRLYEDGADTGRTAEYAPYAILDAKLSWDAPRYTLYLSAENLTNTRYIDHGNVPQPGIWVRAGVRLRLE